MSNSLKRQGEDISDEGPQKKQKIADKNLLDYLHDELVRQILVFLPQNQLGMSDSRSDTPPPFNSETRQVI